MEQCHGSVCFCVDTVTGEQVEGTEHGRGEEYDCSGTTLATGDNLAMKCKVQ